MIENTLNISRYISLISLFISLVLPIRYAFAGYHVSILQYHHVAENTPRITSVTRAEFAEHMSHLKKNHNVVSLQQVKESFETGARLPENAVAITFDDGYSNILQNAHPILVEYDYPYTIFINPAEIGSSAAQLTWEEVREMAKQGATFANHTLDHQHLIRRLPNESEPAWLKRVIYDVETAESIIEEELGYRLRWLAYPFGEFDSKLATALEELGYWAFGQQSGAAAWYSNQLALPRFPASGRYATLKTLTTKLNSLALPVVEQMPIDPKVSLGTEELNVELIVDVEDFRPNQFACYFKGDRVQIDASPHQKDDAIQHALLTPDSDVFKFSFKLDHKFLPGRSRVNCTAPSIDNQGRFYWYSMPFFTATEEGVYPD